jgi:hypothetical protein
LWCEGDAAFVWENFSRNSHPQGRVGGALETGFARCRFNESEGLS